jgi:hypothetical protein
MTLLLNSICWSCHSWTFCHFKSEIKNCWLYCFFVFWRKLRFVFRVSNCWTLIQIGHFCPKVFWPWGSENFNSRVEVLLPARLIMGFTTNPKKERSRVIKLQLWGKWLLPHEGQKTRLFWLSWSNVKIFWVKTQKCSRSRLR